MYTFNLIKNNRRVIGADEFKAMIMLVAPAFHNSMPVFCHVEESINE